MARTRQDRRNDFDEFYSSSINIFTRLKDQDPCAEKFQREYMLNICPGSRAGGTDKRTVEVFWGARNFEIETQGRNWRALTETGATLFLARDDNGFVTISLYPAYTENRKQFETSITLHIRLDPKKLENNNFTKLLWNDFMAYMECTSLDGNPTLWQRLRIWHLRNFKHLIIDNKSTPTKFSAFIQGVFKLVVAACFSGAVLIYFVNLATKSQTTETDTQLKEVNKNLVIVSKQLEKISEDNAKIKTISIATDSLVVKTKQILKSIQTKKP
jgi:hypothetical protein